MRVKPTTAYRPLVPRIATMFRPRVLFQMQKLGGTSNVGRRAYTQTVPPVARRARKWPKRIGVVLALGGGVYAYDKVFNASALSRSLRTGYIG